MTKLPTIIGLSGKAGAGKSTISSLLLELIPQRGELVKLAGPLYGLQKIIYDYLRLPQPKDKDRRLLQLLGTDWGRAQDPEFWIKRYYQNVQDTQVAGIPYVITDDVRFENEAAFIRQMGGVILLVVGRAEGMDSAAAAHSSEAGLPLSQVDFIVDNSGTIQDTRGQVRAFLETL